MSDPILTLSGVSKTYPARGKAQASGSDVDDAEPDADYPDSDRDFDANALPDPLAST